MESKIAERTGRLEIVEVDINLIDPQRIPMRTEDEDISDMVESIKAYGGLLQPVAVKPQANGRYQTVYGWRRVLAYQQLGWKTIPAIVKDVDDEAAIMMSISENEDRREANPVMIGDAIETLISEYRWSIKQIAEKMGKSETYVYNMRKFSAAPRSTRIAVEKGELEPTKALEIMRAPPEKQSGLVERAVKERWMKDETRKQVELVRTRTWEEQERELRRRHEAIKRILPYSGPLTVEWLPGKKEDKRGEVVDTTIKIYDTELKEAEETLRHEHLEFNLNALTRPVVDIYNKAIERLRKTLEDYVSLYMGKQYPHLSEEERGARAREIIEEEEDYINKQTRRVSNWCYIEADRLTDWLEEGLTVLKLV